MYPSTKWILQIRAIFPGPITHTINAMCLTLKYVLNSCVHITIGTLVLIRMHKKADLLEIKVNCMKDRKICVDENKL